MAPSLESGVESRLEAPETGKTVSLIVEVDPDADQINTELEKAGATIEMDLPLNYISVTIAEINLRELSELDCVTSIEIDSEGTVFDSDF